MNGQPKKDKFVKWVIDYDGPILSLNDYNKSWAVLRRLKSEVSEHFAYLILQKRPPRLDWFELRITHNTRLDMDNVTGMIKPIVDTLKKQNIIDDDNKKNWDYYSVRYDPNVPGNVVRIELTGERKLKTA